MQQLSKNDGFLLKNSYLVSIPQYQFEDFLRRDEDCLSQQIQCSSSARPKKNFRKLPFWNGNCLLFYYIVLISLFLLSPVVLAHAEARSSFTAKTDGNNIDFDFRLNSVSIVQLIQKANGDKNSVSKADITKYDKMVLDYLDETVAVSNNGKICKSNSPALFKYDRTIDKIVIKRSVTCLENLDNVTVDCSIFVEEDAPHTITFSFYHNSAREQFVFWGHKVANISIKKINPKDSKRHVSGGSWAGAGRGRAFLKAKQKKKLQNKKKIAGDGNSTDDNPADNNSSPGQAQKLSSAFLSYVNQGIHHILGGLDHVLFVLSLVIVILTWRRLAFILTSFTIAHSITLALGVFSLVKVSPYIVEPLVALSILYVAIENIFKKDPESRAAVTFGFGLIHGLGFSAVLQNLGLTTEDMIPALLGFNAGVEIGQLLVVAPLFPVIVWIHKNREKAYQKLRVVICILIAAAAAWWMVERVIYAVRNLY